MDKTVLFIDDDPGILSSIKRMLRKEDYTQFYVESAKDALELMETKTVDVVVSDLMMPDMNGLTLLMEVKDKYPETVRIILSGYTQVSIILSAIESGDIFRYITKPWKMDSSAKKTIRDALEFSTYLRRNQEIPENRICFTNEEFNALLKGLNAGCIIRMEDGELSFISDNLKNGPSGEPRQRIDISDAESVINIGKRDIGILKVSR